MAVGLRTVLAPPSRPNERWSMDFTLDALATGRKFRTLNNFTRKRQTIQLDTSRGGARVVGLLKRLVDLRGLPSVVVCDNGSEFAAKVLEAWAYKVGLRIHFIRPGKPVENCCIGSFNGRFRDECLNDHWFNDLDGAWKKIEDWRND